MKLPLFFIALAGVCLTGCTSLEVTKLDPTSTASGLRYSLQIPKVKLTTLQKAVYDSPDLTKPRIVAEMKAEVVTIPDTNRTYLINLKPGWFSADSYGITYADNGGLAGYNAASDDQTATVITEIGKIALTGVALAAARRGTEGLDAPPPRGTASVDDSDRRLLNTAIARIDELRQRIDPKECETSHLGMLPDDLKKLCAPLTDDERKELSKLLDGLAALQTALYKDPKRVTDVTYIDLIPVPVGQSTLDDYILTNAKRLLGDQKVVTIAIFKTIP